MWCVKIKMESWSVRILLVIFGIQLVKCCTLTTSDGRVLNEADFQLVPLKDVSNTKKSGELIVEYTTEGVTGFKAKTTETFISANFNQQNKKLTFTAKMDFTEYEKNTTLTRWTETIVLECDKEYTMALQLIINDTDQYPPIFNKKEYPFTLPMPWPATVSIPKVYGAIWVYDADLTSHLSFSPSDDGADKFDIEFTKSKDEVLPDGTYNKPYYILDFKAKEALNESPLKFTITVKDDNNPETSKATTTITITRNPDASTPKSPSFQHHWYLIEMSDSINVNDEIPPKNGPVKFEPNDNINSIILETVDADADLMSHFNIAKVNDGVVIKLTKKFSDAKPEIGLITLKASLENAAQSGYSVLNIVFPSECPATTTAEPCTTPSITTATSTTTSSTVTTPTTTEKFSPTSTEDPCSRCPISTTVCPTTITEPTSTTTIHPSSKSTEGTKSTSGDPCSGCPTVTITEATSCPVCNESTTTTTPSIWSSTDVTTRTSEASTTTCPPCDCSTTVRPSENTTTGSSSSTCEICTTPEVTPCDCSSTTGGFTSPTPCATCEPCPSPEPPAKCTLSFPTNNYIWTLHAGDSGEIGIVEAKSSPPIYPSYITYQIVDKKNDMSKNFKIIEGKMYALNTIEVGYYQFSVSASAKCSDSDAKTTVSLNVYSKDFCGNETDIEILFPEGVTILRKLEESPDPDLFPPVAVPPALTCTFGLKVEPKMTEFQIDDKIGKISMKPIDREAEIFHGASIPEIKLNLTATCSVKKTFSWVDRNAVMDFSSERSVSMIILVYILDKNDHPPEFTNNNITIGYPIKSIAEQEMATQLGIAEAHDVDVGENAELTYHVLDTNEVIIEEISGHYYPHPKFFEYKDFAFKIAAKNGDYYPVCSVKVKILSQKYLTEIRIRGKQVADAQDIVKKISSKTGLEVGFVSARLVKSYGSGDDGETSFEVGIFGKPSYVFTDGMTEMPMGDLNPDDTYSLRLVVYAFKNGEAIDTTTFQDMLKPVGGPMIAKEYAPYTVENEVADQSGAVIALSVILALVIAGVIGFAGYRFWKKRKASRDNDSLEKGLVDEKNDGIKDDSDFIYKSEKASISSGETGTADKVPEYEDSDDMNPDRRKSVAFAEEPQVIPGDDEESQGNATGSVIDEKL